MCENKGKKGGGERVSRFLVSKLYIYLSSLFKLVPLNPPIYPGIYTGRSGTGNVGKVGKVGRENKQGLSEPEECKPNQNSPGMRRPVGIKHVRGAVVRDGGSDEEQEAVDGK